MNRRAMKGGVYAKPTTIGFPVMFNRNKMRNTLYKLTSELIDGDKIKHILDFSFYTGGRIMNFFIKEDKYAEILINGLGVSQPVDKENIRIIIGRLFEGGIDKMKERQLVIIEPVRDTGSATIEITGEGIESDNKITIQSPEKKFFNFLVELGDEIMPIQQ
jgi:hypothetical protein